jgi:hypothetical protein
MNSNFSVFAAWLSIAAIFFLAGCGGGSTKVKPHQHVMGDTYCTYEVTASNGGGAIPVGSIVCIYCPDPFAARCDPNFTMEPADGITYDLKKISNTCSDCPQNTIDRGWTYEYE